MTPIFGLLLGIMLCAHWGQAAPLSGHPPLAPDSTFTQLWVTHAGTSGPGSMKRALDSVHQSPENYVISFADSLAGQRIPCYGRVEIQGQLSIDGDLDGDGQGDIILDGLGGEFTWLGRVANTHISLQHLRFENIVNGHLTLHTVFSFLFGATLHIQNCHFDDIGGNLFRLGTFYSPDPPIDLTVSHSQFTNIRGGQHPIFTGYNNSVSARFSHCLFQNNAAGEYHQTSSLFYTLLSKLLVIENSLITDNTAHQMIHADGQQFILRQVTVANNTLRGGVPNAAVATYHGKSVIANSILAGNTTETGQSSNLYADIEERLTLRGSLLQAAIAGIFEDETQGDYRLRAGSPAIDLGDPAEIKGLHTDVRRGVRPTLHTLPDAGAYEFGNAPTQVLRVSNDAASGPGSLNDILTRISGQSGDYFITFEAALAGKTIPFHRHLVQHGNLRIEGDLNGDDLPDITLDGSGYRTGTLTNQAGSTLRLHGLIFKHFFPIKNQPQLIKITAEAKVQVSHCEFRNSTGPWFSVSTATDSVVVNVSDCLFADNVSNYSVVYFGNGFHTQATFQNCRVQGNDAGGQYLFYALYSHLDIQNSLITDNIGICRAAYATGDHPGNAGSMTLRHVTVANNAVSRPGCDAIDGFNTSLINSLVAANTNALGVARNLGTLDDLRGSLIADSLAGFFEGANVQNYQLAGTSPAVNAADSTQVNGLRLDLANNPRPAPDGLPDAGAYEFTVPEVSIPQPDYYFQFDDCRNHVVREANNRYDGIGYNTPFVYGYAGGGLRFDGATSYFDMRNRQGLLTSEHSTLALWIKTAKTDRQTLVVKNKRNHKFGYLLELAQGGIPSLLLGGMDTPGPYAASASVSDGMWHHLAATVDATHVRLYIDGVLSASYAKPGGMLNDEPYAPVFVGSREDKPTQFKYQGTVDEIRWYTHALSAAEVQALASLPENASICPDLSRELIGSWSFDQCSPNLVNEVNGIPSTVTTDQQLQVPGYANQGISFTTPGQQLVLHDSLLPNRVFVGISYSVWVKPTAYGYRQSLIQRSESGSAMNIALNQGKVEVYPGGLGGAFWVKSTPLLPLDEWTHVGVSVNQGQVRIFINGQLVKSQGFYRDHLNFTAQGSHVVGARPDGSRAFAGDMDELRIFSGEVPELQMQEEHTRLAFSPTYCPALGIGSWKFENCANSSVIASLGSIHGTLEAGASRSSGYEGSGIEFNGVGQVNLGNDSAWEFGQAFSVSTWVRTAQSSNHVVLLTKNRNPQGFSYSFNLDQGRPSAVLGSGFTMPGPYTSATAINDNNWHHVAWVYDRGTLDLYVDGVLDATFENIIGTLRSNAGTQVWLGNRNDKTGRGFVGTLDELNVYASALRAPEVSQLASLSANPSSCLASRWDTPADSDQTEARRSVVGLFPNPAKGAFTLCFHEASGEEITVEIVNVQGKRTTLFHGPLAALELPLTVQDPTPGFYWVILSGAGPVSRHPLILE